ncbi:PREDICTED: thioredoxin-like 1-1, chloroplastic [Camelina sativa]|uniref:Thioredoxin-like 1-1, chloroplastic n=1 Tax=Camelina sativa TaxID=90675 RepID=A0ABM0WSU0_CAMSA|nr:PREDICTED: thioredoxin-like 1-1, chloroplastic [Camelina sativa]
MAEVISKTSLFIGACGNHHRVDDFSVSPVSFGGFGLKKSFSCLKVNNQKPLLRSVFHGRQIVLGEGAQTESFKRSSSSITAQTTLRIGTAQKWWEKGLKENMREISSAQELVDSLTNAGDKLVVVDFFSPGCGGCKALHPKICQFAEMNPAVQFLQVNYEEHKSMCYSLGVHVLPFFRFYRGSQGRVCSFSCTNATIKKFRDALAKHGPDRCRLGPTKGLEEKELVALAANKELNFSYTPKPVPAEKEAATPHSNPSLPVPLPSMSNNDGKTLVSAGR